MGVYVNLICKDCKEYIQVGKLPYIVQKGTETDIRVFITHHHEHNLITMDDTDFDLIEDDYTFID